LTVDASEPARPSSPTSRHRRGRSASGASTATVNASGTLDAEASGASHVRYLGSPTLGNVEVSGASSVERE
jgi:hypothetical protein